jgi:hypothetical protein
MKTALFSVITQRVAVIMQRLAVIFYHYLLRNNPEERSY